VLRETEKVTDRNYKNRNEKAAMRGRMGERKKKSVRERQ
jgi:hypothetical protein